MQALTTAFVILPPFLLLVVGLVPNDWAKGNPRLMAVLAANVSAVSLAFALLAGLGYLATGFHGWGYGRIERVFRFPLGGDAGVGFVYRCGRHPLFRQLSGRGPRPGAFHEMAGVHSGFSIDLGCLRQSDSIHPCLDVH